MRVSVRSGDPGYQPFGVTSRCRVYVDDEEVTTDCHTADEETGEAWCYLKDEDGNRVLRRDPYNPNAATEIVRKGNVRIVIEEHDYESL